MINRQMKKAILKCLSETDAFGAKKYLAIDEILIAINYNTQIWKTDDLKYRDCEYTGLTAYKEFDLEKEYLIICENKSYKIAAINTFGRLTQLILQAVK